MHSQGMAPTTYADVLVRNVKAARARLGLDQADAVARMRALGFATWHRQTMGKVERAERRLTAEEVLGLAACLETTVQQLMSPRITDAPVELPSGEVLASIQVMALVSDEHNGPTNRGTRWVGNSFEQGWPAEAVHSWGTGFPRET